MEQTLAMEPFDSDEEEPSDFESKKPILGYLVLLESKENQTPKGKPFEIRDCKISIGRHPDNTLTIQDNTVSSKHASIEIDIDSNEAWVEDLGSTNRTRVGKTLSAEKPNKRVKANKTRPILSGSFITFGDVHYIFYFTADYEAPSVGDADTSDRQESNGVAESTPPASEDVSATVAVPTTVKEATHVLDDELQLQLDGDDTDRDSHTSSPQKKSGFSDAMAETLLYEDDNEAVPPIDTAAVSVVPEPISNKQEADDDDDLELHLDLDDDDDVNHKSDILEDTLAYDEPMDDTDNKIKQDLPETLAFDEAVENEDLDKSTAMDATLAYDENDTENTEEPKEMAATLAYDENDTEGTEEPKEMAATLAYDGEEVEDNDEPKELDATLAYDPDEAEEEAPKDMEATLAYDDIDVEMEPTTDKSKDPVLQDTMPCDEEDTIPDEPLDATLAYEDDNEDVSKEEELPATLPADDVDLEATQPFDDTEVESSKNEELPATLPADDGITTDDDEQMPPQPVSSKEELPDTMVAEDTTEEDNDGDTTMQLHQEDRDNIRVLPGMHELPSLPDLYGAGDSFASNNDKKDSPLEDTLVVDDVDMDRTQSDVSDQLEDTLPINDDSLVDSPIKGGLLPETMAMEAVADDDSTTDPDSSDVKSKDKKAILPELAATLTLDDTEEETQPESQPKESSQDKIETLPDTLPTDDAPDTLPTDDASDTHPNEEANTVPIEPIIEPTDEPTKELSNPEPEKDLEPNKELEKEEEQDTVPTPSPDKSESPQLRRSPRRRAKRAYSFQKKIAAQKQEAEAAAKLTTEEVSPQKDVTDEDTLPPTQESSPTELSVALSPAKPTEKTDKTGEEETADDIDVEMAERESQSKQRKGRRKGSKASPPKRRKRGAAPKKSPKKKTETKPIVRRRSTRLSAKAESEDTVTTTTTVTTEPIAQPLRRSRRGVKRKLDITEDSESDTKAPPPKRRRVSKRLAAKAAVDDDDTAEDVTMQNGVDTNGNLGGLSSPTDDDTLKPATPPSAARPLRRRGRSKRAVASPDIGSDEPPQLTRRSTRSQTRATKAATSTEVEITEESDGEVPSKKKAKSPPKRGQTTAVKRTMRNTRAVANAKKNQSKAIVSDTQSGAEADSESESRTDNNDSEGSAIATRTRSHKSDSAVSPAPTKRKNKNSAANKRKAATKTRQRKPVKAKTQVRSKRNQSRKNNSPTAAAAAATRARSTRSRKTSLNELSSAENEELTISTSDATVNDEAAVGNKSVVILRTGTEAEKIDKKLRKLGAIILDDFDPSVTHLVSSVPRRTLKFVAGLAYAKHLVTDKWAEECTKKNTLDIRESKYFPSGSEVRKVERMYSFKLKKSFEDAHSQKLFRGLKLYFNKDVSDQLTKAISTMFESHGGTYITDLNTRRNKRAAANAVDKSVIVIGNKTTTKEYRNLTNFGYKIYNHNIVVTSILRQDITFDDDDFLLQ